MYGSVGYSDRYFGESRVVNNWKDLAEGPLDFLVFWGGTDVNPELYGQRNKFSGRPDIGRDAIEKKIFEDALERGIPMLGICRGSQFLTVMSGGELYQDVGNAHLGSHSIYTEDGQTLKATSTHHQMMSPQRTNHKVIAYARQPVLSYKKEQQVEPPKFDYEIVWYPETKCLCIQGHPEYMDIDSPFSQYSFKLIKEYLNANYQAPRAGQLYVPGGTPV